MIISRYFILVLFINIIVSACARLVLFINIIVSAFASMDVWLPWNACSVTCGNGIQVQRRICIHKRSSLCGGKRARVRPCVLELCPSYLDQPRIHFSGKFVFDSTTANNFRCTFDPEYFCPSCNRNKMQVYEEPGIKVKKSDDSPQNTQDYVTNPYWNDFGGNHCYFRGVKVTSACWGHSAECTTDDSIVGRAIENPQDGRIVDLDVDWQKASTIYGLEIHIPGVLRSWMKKTGVTKLPPMPQSDPSMLMGVFKSKLVNVTWLDLYYAKQFKNSHELSINLVVDMFQSDTRSGRLTGTIGMTSSDDPLNTFGGRKMRSKSAYANINSDLPFHINQNTKVLTLDLSMAFQPISRQKLKNLDLVMEANADILRRFPSRILHCGAHTFLPFSLFALNFLFASGLSQFWYVTYGGIFEISLNKFDDELIDSMKNSRLALVEGVGFQRQNEANKNHKYRVTNISSCNILFIEDKFGLNLQVFGDFTTRLSKNQVWNFTMLASSFGHPVAGQRIELKSLKRSRLYNACEGRCNPYISEPRGVLKWTSPKTTDRKGRAKFEIKVVKNPGNPRGCGIDGQIYPLGAVLIYTSPSKETYSIGEGGMFSNLDAEVLEKANYQCGLEASYFNAKSAVRVFSSMPKHVMRKKCPTWSKDVKPIFYFYGNIAPVMAKHDIINLKDYDDIRSKLRLINMSMFGYDIDHPNFMPVTRDLSRDKTKLIQKWLNCELNGKIEETITNQNKFNIRENLKNTCGNSVTLLKSLTRIRSLLHLAFWIEFYTIPPYLTAYLSIKPHSASKIKHLLKSVATEEMLHLALVANLLNSVGGEPRLTDLYWLPNYPTYFPSKHLIQILPSLEVGLEKFSAALAKNIFSEIEKPANFAVFQTNRLIAKLWKDLQAENHDSEPKNFRNASFLDSKAKIISNDGLRFWRNTFKFFSKQLSKHENREIDTIGGLYVTLSLRLIQLESCLKVKNSEQTIFNDVKQLNARHWYVSEGVSKGKLFAVTNLKTALAALIEISNEGEGGLACSPFISTKNVSKTFNEDLITSKSHFVKFQEMAHGRQLAVMMESPPPLVSCMDRTHEKCSCVLEHQTVSNLSSENCFKFCFAGEALSVDEEVEIWPIKSFPYFNNGSLDLSSVPSETKDLANHFDRTYTALIHCLQSAFTGKPNKIAECMGNMYELLVVGKKLVRLSLYEVRQPSRTFNAAPRWKYVKDLFKNEELFTKISSIDRRPEEFC